MNRLPVLKDELAFLEKHLPELEGRPDLVHLAASVKKQIDKIRQQIRDLQENK
jgi:DNA polymerase III delta prime subunit